MTSQHGGLSHYAPVIHNWKSICITSRRQRNTGRPRAEAILTKSCVVEGFVTQEAKNVPKIFLIFFLNFAAVFVPGSYKYLRNN